MDNTYLIVSCLLVGDQSENLCAETCGPLVRIELHVINFWTFFNALLWHYIDMVFLCYFFYKYSIYFCET